MGVVIDANTLPAVFMAANPDHAAFRPVLHWVVCGKAKIVIGGSKYLAELQRMYRYAILLAELANVNKVHRADAETVDRREQEVKSMTQSKDFNDPHIVALLATTRCRVFCSNDARSFKFISDPQYYKSGADRPKIYTNVRHKPAKELLCDENLCPACAPHLQLTRSQIEAISFFQNET